MFPHAGPHGLNISCHYMCITGQWKALLKRFNVGVWQSLLPHAIHLIRKSLPNWEGGRERILDAADGMGSHLDVR